MSNKSNNHSLKARLSQKNIKAKLPIWNDVNWIKKIERMKIDI